MLVQILLWLLMATLISIFPLIVYIYWNKIEFKKKEIMNHLSGKLGKLYLNAYYPQIQEGKTANENETVAHKIEDIIEEFFNKEYRLLKYLVPLFSLVIIVAIMLLMFTLKYFTLVSLSKTEYSFIQSIPTVIYLGFWGAFLSSIRDIYKKYNTMDLTPCFLYSVIFKILVCSALAYLWSVIFTSDVAIFVSFGTGFLPVQSIQNQIIKLTYKKSGDESQAATTSNLSKLQGLNSHTIDRLEEEDILNCQTLAYSDPIKILFKTQYQLKIILDWIDQALLYGYVGDKLNDLRVVGIRGIVEFALLYEKKDNPALIESIATRINSTPELVKNFIDAIYSDPHIEFICNLFSESSG